MPDTTGFRMIPRGMILLTLPILMVSLPAHTLTVDEYTAQVQARRPGSQQVTETITASSLKRQEANLFFTPRLLADVRVAGDSALANPPLLVYDRIHTQRYSVGVAQEFSFGLQARASYELSHTRYAGALFPGNAASDFYDARPVVELSVPLWKNVLGVSSRSNRDMLVYQTQAEGLGAQAQLKALAAEAESVYWRLVVTRDVRRTQETALRQAQAILDYVTRKATMNLGDDADVLQARALVEARRFELSQAENDERQAARTFNGLRYSAEETVTEPLDALSVEALEQIPIPTVRPADRADVLAAAAESRLLQASAIVAGDRNRPSLDLYGTFALNGRGDGVPDALSGSYTDHRNTAAAGVRFSMPLDVGSMTDTVSASRHSAHVAELKLEQKRFDQDRDWTEWVRRMEDSRKSLRQTRAIEAAQRTKLEHERKRLRQGRTTTYQVLLFEQDYTQAELTRIRVASLILHLQAQLKLYSSADPTQGPMPSNRGDL